MVLCIVQGKEIERPDAFRSHGTYPDNIMVLIFPCVRDIGRPDQLGGGLRQVFSGVMLELCYGSQAREQCVVEEEDRGVADLKALTTPFCVHANRYQGLDRARSKHPGCP